VRSGPAVQALVSALSLRSQMPPSPGMQISPTNPPPKRRRKSFGANDPEVITIGRSPLSSSLPAVHLITT
jgi:hypothetical protein